MSSLLRKYEKVKDANDLSPGKLHAESQTHIANFNFMGLSHFCQCGCIQISQEVRRKPATRCAVFCWYKQNLHQTQAQQENLSYPNMLINLSHLTARNHLFRSLTPPSSPHFSQSPPHVDARAAIPRTSGSCL